MKIVRYLVPTGRWARWRLAVLLVIFLGVVYTHQNRFLFLVAHPSAIYDQLLNFVRTSEAIFHSSPQAG